MFTGVGAGRHGIWDFHERDESGYGLRPVNGSYRREPAVWQRLSAAGRRVGVINVPFTWPVDDVNGFALAGFDAYGRRDGFATPGGPARGARGALRPARAGPRVPGHARGRHRPRLRCGASPSSASSSRCGWPSASTPSCCRRLHGRRPRAPPGLGRVGAQRRGRARWRRVYGILDEAVGALAGALGGDIMLVSDHGGGPLHGVVNLNAWLAEQGLLEYAGAAELMRGGQLQRMAAARALALWRRLPLDLRTRVKQRLGGLRERSYELQNFHVVDFERTQAFAYGTFGNIVINVQGRERHGIVAPGRRVRGRARRDREARCASCAIPASGRQIVAAVHRREELFSGPHIERVPDLVVEFVDYEWLGKGNLKSRTESIWDKVEIAGTNAAYVGSHRHEGIVALAGPSAAPGGLFASIEDIAPTIQYLLGEPIPESMEGQLIDAAIDPALLESRPPVYVADDVEVVERRARLRRRRGRRRAGSPARPRLHRVGIEHEDRCLRTRLCRDRLGRLPRRARARGDRRRPEPRQGRDGRAGPLHDRRGAHRRARRRGRRVRAPARDGRCRRGRGGERSRADLRRHALERQRLALDDVPRARGRRDRRGDRDARPPLHRRLPLDDAARHLRGHAHPAPRGRLGPARGRRLRRRREPRVPARGHLGARLQRSAEDGRRRRRPAHGRHGRLALRRPARASSTACRSRSPR